MMRILRSFDLLEAHIIVARLRVEGIDAHVFDADFVRQNWFRMLAYGGFRIVVPDESASAACDILQRYRAGTLALGDAADDEESSSACPRCRAAAGRDDPQPRRNVFLAFIVYAVVFSLALVRWSPTESGLALLCCAALGGGLCLPWLLVRYFKWRLRCPNCAYCWRAPPPNRFAALAQATETAERAGA